MIDRKKLEDFIVNTDDVMALMELYATRIKSYPDNRAYYHALAIQCGEFRLAAVHLGLPSVTEAAQELHQLAKTLDDQNSQATTRMMEVFLEELHDLQASLKRFFRERNEAFSYRPRNLSLFQNFMRKLASGHHPAPATVPAVPVSEDLVEDPFDEMESLGSFVDGFLDDLDSAFDSITTSTPAMAEPVSTGSLELSQAEQDEVEKLFLSISGAYIQPVKEFISELKSGQADKNWVDICLSSLRLIEDAGTKMSFENVTTILSRFRDLMQQAKDSSTPVISRDIRLQLLKEYANLSSLMPEAFATSGAHASRGSVRDTVIVNAILRKTPGIGPVSRNKLLAAGLNSLDKYLVASSQEIAAVSGITETQAQTLCEAFKAYRANTPTHQDGTPQHRTLVVRLFQLLKNMRATQARYRETTRMALEDPAQEDTLRQLRSSRQSIMWDINIVLAELGSLELVEDLRRMVFDRRIQRLDAYLENEARSNL